MNTNLIIYLACICFLFIFGRLFIGPLRKILKLILNSILGGILIWIINLVGTNFAFHLGLNIFTSIFVGLLGVPRRGLFSNSKAFYWIVNCYIIIKNVGKFVFLRL